MCSFVNLNRFDLFNTSLGQERKTFSRCLWFLHPDSVAATEVLDSWPPPRAPCSVVLSVAPES